MLRYCLTLLLSIITISIYSLDYTNFKKADYDYVIFYYEPTVEIEYIQKLYLYFESAYELCGKELGIPLRKPTIMVFEEGESIYDYMEQKAGYDKFLRETGSYPRMNAEYVMFTTKNRTPSYISHEYTHRLIEQIAGNNSQINYKWLDEGLAEYFGYENQRIYNFEMTELSIKEIAYLLDNVKNSTSLSYLLTEDYWVNQMMNGNSALIYNYSFEAVNYLIKYKGGFKKIKKVLQRIRAGQIFIKAFEEVYHLKLSEYDKILKNNLNRRSEGIICSALNNTHLSQHLKPIISDLRESQANHLLPDFVDIESVYYLKSKEYLDFIIKTYGKVTPSCKELIITIEIDLNLDGKVDYQLGIDSQRCWIWSLVGEGCSNSVNLAFLYNYRHGAYGNEYYIRLPLYIFKNSNVFLIKCSNLYRQYRDDTNWGMVN